MMLELQYVNIDKNDIEINKAELSQRLKTSVGFKNDAIINFENRVIQELQPRCCVAQVCVKCETPEKVMLDTIEIFSKDLYKNLSGCSRAYVMAVTLGLGVDRLVSSLRISSPSGAFIADAIASAYADAAADYVSEMLSKRNHLKPRYSPGYGDLSLEFQKDILNMLNAHRLLGIELGENLLMTPKKSITAIQGVID